LELLTAVAVTAGVNAAWLVVVSTLVSACSAAPSRNIVIEERCFALAPARGPFVEVTASAVSVPPPVELRVRRDVLLKGQTPVVDVYSDTEEGDYKETDAFELRDAHGVLVPRICDASKRPLTSRGYATLSFECQHPVVEGVYDITILPSQIGLSGPLATAPLRVLAKVPESPPAPSGWVAAPLASGFIDECQTWGASYEVRVERGEPRFSVRRRNTEVRIPEAIAPRMSTAHAQSVKFVFEDDEGWVVMFDLGEFGGGVEWYPKAGGEPRSIVIGQDDGEYVPQNVNQAMTLKGVLYVLQGLSHLGSSGGQLAMLWREHDHFTSQVIARYPTEPTDWLLQPDGTWLVLTEDAIWQTSATNGVTLVARLASGIDYPASLAQSYDATLYVGGRGGVLRLTRLWDEHPRYASDLLIPKGSAQETCWTDWLRTHD
jgi:hypothetical protein